MTLLVLAGTGEARELLVRLSQRTDVVASLAGAVARPMELPAPVRVGGFGGAAGFEAYLEAQSVRAVVDATHPFAAAITARTHQICRARRLAYLRVQRPGWTAGPGDNWVWVDEPSEIASLVQVKDIVFLATGRQTLASYAELGVSQVYCRQIDPPDRPFPFQGGEYVVGRPPFSLKDEVALFKRLGITVLVVKDAGGDLSRSKLDAARMLRIPVILLRRPALPAGDVVETVEEALQWIETRA